MAPAHTPQDIVMRLNRETNAMLRSAQVRDKLASQGAEVAGSAPAEFAAIVKRDIQKWVKATAGPKLQLQ